MSIVTIAALHSAAAHFICHYAGERKIGVAIGGGERRTEEVAGVDSAKRASRLDRGAIDFGRTAGISGFEAGIAIAGGTGCAQHGFSLLPKQKQYAAIAPDQVQLVT